MACRSCYDPALIVTSLKELEELTITLNKSKVMLRLGRGEERYLPKAEPGKCSFNCLLLCFVVVLVVCFLPSISKRVIKSFV